MNLFIFSRKVRLFAAVMVKIRILENLCTTFSFFKKRIKTFSKEFILLGEKDTNYIYYSCFYINNNLHKMSGLNLSSGFPTRSDTNWAVQPLKMARGLSVTDNFRFRK